MKKIFTLISLLSAMILFAKDPDLKVTSLVNTPVADSLKVEISIDSDTAGPVMTVVVFLSNDATLDASDQIRMASQGVLQKGTLSFTGVINFKTEKIDSNNKYTIVVVTHDYTGNPFALNLAGLKPDANPTDNFKVAAFAFPPAVVKTHNAPLSNNEGIDLTKITFGSYESSANATAMNVQKATNCNLFNFMYNKNFKITNGNASAVSNIPVTVFLSKDGVVDNSDFVAYSGTITLPPNSDYILNAQSSTPFTDKTDQEIVTIMSSFVNWTTLAEYGQAAKSYVILRLNITIGNTMSGKTANFGNVSGYTYTTTVCSGTEQNEETETNFLSKTGTNTYEIINNKEVTLSVFNLNGQEVLKKDINSSETIDLNNLTQGLYIIKLHSAAINKSERIIVE
jgi:hypothetical protein